MIRQIAVLLGWLLGAVNTAWACGEAAPDSLGFLRRAAETAGQIPDHGLRVESLRQVAMALNTAGDRESAAALLRKAETTVSDCPVNSRYSLLAEVGVAWSELGRKDVAKRLLQAALQAVPQAGEGLHTPEAYVASAYVEVGRQQALSGFPVAAAMALQTAMEKSRELDEYPCWNVVAEIVAARAEWGDFEQADKLVSLLGHEHARDKAWEAIATAKAKRGDFLGALAAIGRMTGRTAPLMGLVAANKQHAKAGDHATATKCFENAIQRVRQIGIPYPPLHSLAYGLVADVQSDAGYFAAAQKTISLMKPPGEIEYGVVQVLPTTVAHVAAAQTKSGDVPGAMAWARAQGAPSVKTYIYLGVGTAFLKRAAVVDP